jgi:hypothetical protein
VVRVDKNVVRWSEPFLSRIARKKAAPGALIVGYPPSHDPAELVVHAGQNRLEAPTAELFVPSLVIHAALYNSQQVIDRRFRLPMSALDSRGPGREARTQPGASTR